MKKILLCVLILLVSVNVFAADVDIKQLTEVANNGDVQAQFELGNCYAFGKGVEQDFKQAAYWYQEAVEQGHAEAQVLLGACYYSGYGVAQSFTQAVSWFHKAAEQGHDGAQYFLGDCYYFGEGVPKNYKQAHMWYSLGLAQTANENVRYVLNLLEAEMPPAEIAEAQQMAAEWMEKHQ